MGNWSIFWRNGVFGSQLAWEGEGISWLPVQNREWSSAVEIVWCRSKAPYPSPKISWVTPPRAVPVLFSRVGLPLNIGLTVIVRIVCFSEMSQNTFRWSLRYYGRPWMKCGTTRSISDHNRQGRIPPHTIFKSEHAFTILMHENHLTVFWNWFFEPKISLTLRHCMHSPVKYSLTLDLHSVTKGDIYLLRSIVAQQVKTKT